MHQGDGTADIFGGEPRVFTFSMHGERNFPVRKIASSLDIALPDRTGDAAYLERLRAVLPELERRARPDIVFYNAGVDPHAEDRLGRLALSDDGLRAARPDGDRLLPRARYSAVRGDRRRLFDRSAALAARHAILFEVAAAFADQLRR